MAVFANDEVSWTRIDYATIAGDGLACVELRRHDECRAWLERRHYRIVTIDCALGLPALCKQLSDIFDWPAQFGYEFAGHSLDALRDGFTFAIPDEGGVVLMLLRPDALWTAERSFMDGLFAIAAEHTRRQMAEGKRFFTILLLERDSQLPGATIEPRQIPALWWQPGPGSPFRE